VTEAVATDECRASANGGQNERCGTHTAAGGMRDNGGSEEHREEKDDYVGNDVDVKLDDEGWKQVGSSHRAALLAEANRDRMEAQRSADAAAQLQAEAAARQIQRTWRRRAVADTNKQAPVAGEPNDVKLQGGYGGKHGGRKKQRCRRGQKEPTDDDLAELMALRKEVLEMGQQQRQQPQQQLARCSLAQQPAQWHGKQSTIEAAHFQCNGLDEIVADATTGAGDQSAAAGPGANEACPEAGATGREDVHGGADWQSGNETAIDANAVNGDAVSIELAGLRKEVAEFPGKDTLSKLGPEMQLSLLKARDEQVQRIAELEERGQCT